MGADDAAGRRFAPCGNECGACPRYVATRAGDEAGLAELAALWHRLGWRDRVVPTAEMTCGGCAPGLWCRHGIVACAAERRVASCAACESYPCDRLETALVRSAAAAEDSRTTCDGACFRSLERAFFRKTANLGASRRAFLASRSG